MTALLFIRRVFPILFSCRKHQPATTMTTAHRPTWKAAVGRAQEGGLSTGGVISTSSSARDLASHTKLKFRTGSQQAGSDRREELLKESLRKMEEAEALSEMTKRRVLQMGRERLLLENGGEKVEEEGRLKLLKQTEDVDEEKIRAKYDDEDDDGDSGRGGWSDLDDDGGGGINLLDRESDESDLDASEDDDGDLDSDDEDEEAALQAELAKIRAERAAAKAREEAEVSFFFLISFDLAS